MSEATLSTAEAAGQRLHDKGFRVGPDETAHMGQVERPTEQSPTYWRDRVARSENRNSFQYGQRGDHGVDPSPAAPATAIKLEHATDQMPAAGVPHPAETLAAAAQARQATEASALAQDTQAVGAMLRETATAERAAEDQAVDRAREQEQAKAQEQARTEASVQDRE